MHFDKMKVRPGITGYTQAYYRNSISTRDKRLLDAWYANNVTMWLDIKILWKTVFGGLKNDEVIGIVSINSTVSGVKDMLESLNSVVLILIILSGALSFVVLYNLSYINISERKREISTLKVLGFYDEEVDSYITRENYFITIVGILLGIFLGGYISHYVIKTCEPHDLLFLKQIKTSSYIISALIASAFTIIVSFITHNSLKKIDMIESLKSNE